MEEFQRGEYAKLKKCGPFADVHSRRVVSGGLVAGTRNEIDFGEIRAEAVALEVRFGRNRRSGVESKASLLTPVAECQRPVEARAVKSYEDPGQGSLHEFARVGQFEFSARHAQRPDGGGAKGLEGVPLGFGNLKAHCNGFR